MTIVSEIFASFYVYVIQLYYFIFNKIDLCVHE